MESVVTAKTETHPTQTQIDRPIDKQNHRDHISKEKEQVKVWERKEVEILQLINLWFASFSQLSLASFTFFQEKVHCIVDTSSVVVGSRKHTHDTIYRNTNNRRS